MKNPLIVPVVMIFMGIFIAFILTYGMVSPGEEVQTHEVINALISFVSFPVVGLLLVVKSRKTMGHTISFLSPFVGLATFLLIKSI